MFNEFFQHMRKHVPADARIVFCQFRGSPDDDIIGKWRARVLNNPDAVDELANVYLCVSAMKRNARGEFRRRKENFAGGLLLMIDDIGSGPGSKFPLSVLDPLEPTAMVETSPDNFQAVYMFDDLITDEVLFDALIRAFISKQFLDSDTGMAGVNRVFRPPYGINGKSKYDTPDGKKWHVRMTHWNPERRYSVQQIADAFDLELVKANPPPRDSGIINAAKAERIRAFVDTRAALRASGMLKREDADLSGWIPVTCPWTHEHTGGVDNGAAIRLPEWENDWNGGYRCHHGHCQNRGWRDLTDWLAEEQAQLLEMINARAGDRHEYKLQVGGGA